MTDTLAQLTPDRENLEKILEQVVSRNFSASNPKGCFVVNTAIEFAGHDKEIRQIVEDNVKQTVAAFEKFIRSGQEKGYFGNAINPNDLAVALFHRITALRVTGKVVTGKSFFNKTIRAFMQLFN
jgi:TetR/AcrR family transcriptional repressor of nem operon